MSCTVNFYQDTFVVSSYCSFAHECILKYVRRDMYTSINTLLVCNEISWLLSSDSLSLCPFHAIFFCHPGGSGLPTVPHFHFSLSAIHWREPLERRARKATRCWHRGALPLHRAVRSLHRVTSSVWLCSQSGEGGSAEWMIEAKR